MRVGSHPTVEDVHNGPQEEPPLMGRLPKPPSPPADSTVARSMPMSDALKATFQNAPGGSKDGNTEQVLLNRMASELNGFMDKNVTNGSHLDQILSSAQALHDSQSYEKKAGFWPWLQNTFNIGGYRDRQTAANRDLQSIQTAVKQRRAQLDALAQRQKATQASQAQVLADARAKADALRKAEQLPQKQATTASVAQRPNLAETSDARAKADAQGKADAQKAAEERLKRPTAAVGKFLSDFRTRAPGVFTREQRDTLRARKESALQTLDQLQKQTNDPTEQSILRALRNRVSNSVIPDSAGGSVRFAQAQYSARRLLDHQATLDASLEKIEERPDLFRGKGKIEGSVSRSNIADAEAMIAADKAGLSPLKRTSLEGSQASLEAVRTFRSAATTKNVFQISVPGHAMMAATDPKTNTFRLFDPNIGLLKFQDPDTFARAASAITQSYQPGSSGNVDMDVRPFIEAPISQSGVDPNFALDSGVCLALSQQAAKYFLEHPDLKGNVTAKMLDLPEFDEAQTHLVRGNNLLAQGKLNEATQAFQQVSSAYPKEYLQEIRDPILEAARSGDLTKALSLANAAVTQNPDDPVLLALKGRLNAAIQKGPSKAAPTGGQAREAQKATPALQPAATMVGRGSGTGFLTLTSLGLKPS